MDYLKRHLNLVAIFIVLVGALALILGNSISHNNQAKVAELKLQKDESSSIASALDYYYAQHSAYPVSLSKLDANNQGMSHDLKDFSYRVAGDYQTYKITYVDSNNMLQTHLGNYRKDLH